MKTRIVIAQLEPDAYKAMMGLEKYLTQSTIKPSLAEIIRVRAMGKAPGVVGQCTLRFT